MNLVTFQYLSRQREIFKATTGTRANVRGSHRRAQQCVERTHEVNLKRSRNQALKRRQIVLVCRRIACIRVGRHWLKWASRSRLEVVEQHFVSRKDHRQSANL